MINFIDDEEKYVDFLTLDKEEFLKMYSYLTEEEYNNSVIDYVNDTLERYTDDEVGENQKDFYLAMNDKQKLELFENTLDINKDIDNFETDLVVCFDYGMFH